MTQTFSYEEHAALSAKERAIVEPMMEMYGGSPNAFSEAKLVAWATEWRELHAEDDVAESAARLIWMFLNTYPELEGEGKVDGIGGCECCNSLALMLQELVFGLRFPPKGV